MNKLLFYYLISLCIIFSVKIEALFFFDPSIVKIINNSNYDTDITIKDSDEKINDIKYKVYANSSKLIYEKLKQTNSAEYEIVKKKHTKAIFLKRTTSILILNNNKEFSIERDKNKDFIIIKDISNNIDKYYKGSHKFILKINNDSTISLKKF